MSKNKSKKDKASLKNLEEQGITELTENVWGHLAGLIEDEIKKPDENSVWPRKMSVLLSNGSNQLVAGKVEVQQFTDVRNSSKKLGKFFGNKNGFDSIEITEEKGKVHSMSLESDPVFFIDFGPMVVEGISKSPKTIDVA